jgi:hypothetical protein
MLGVAGLALADSGGAGDAAVGVGLGRGVELRSAEDRFVLTVRGRVQLRASASVPGVEGDPADLAFQVRRARLVLRGALRDSDLDLYVQLGLAPQDLEPDLPVPIRDAAVTWSRLRDLQIRFGQMKVPFNRERVISSSALQLVDRSIANAELNLDRDVGLQLLSDDLFGLGGRLRYHLGVFGGEGRNRWGPGPGLLYVGRVEVQPFGGFDDAYSEGDLTRDARPRLAVGGSVAFNHLSVRERSTHGAFFASGAHDSLSAQGDLMFKVRGLSLLGELLWRRSTPSRVEPGGSESDAGGATGGTSRSALGWMAQLGYALPAGAEVAVRFAEVRPLDGVVSSVETRREATAGASWYVRGHDLKVQADYTVAFADPAGPLVHLGRVQTQVFF